MQCRITPLGSLAVALTKHPFIRQFPPCSSSNTIRRENDLCTKQNLTTDQLCGHLATTFTKTVVTRAPAVSSLRGLHPVFDHRSTSRRRKPLPFRLTCLTSPRRLYRGPNVCRDVYVRQANAFFQPLAR